MKHLKRFKNQTEYLTYLDADDIWLPRVSLIINGGETPANQDKYSDTGPSRVEYSRIGTEFIQVANGGTMYFTNQTYVDPSTGHDIEYTAYVEGDAICIRTIDKSTGETTNDAYIDDEAGQIVVNYPNAVRVFNI